MWDRDVAVVSSGNRMHFTPSTREASIQRGGRNTQLLRDFHNAERGVGQERTSDLDFAVIQGPGPTPDAAPLAAGDQTGASPLAHEFDLGWRSRPPVWERGFVGWIHCRTPVELLKQRRQERLTRLGHRR